MTTPTYADTRPDTYRFEVGRDAVDAIAACGNRVAELAHYYGEFSPEHLKAATSLAHQLSRLFGLPFAQKTIISKDMVDLSLYVMSGIHFGIIFHADRRRCTKDGCHAYANDDGHVWTYMRDYPICEDGSHEWSYPLDAPAPGTWSFHS